MDYQSHLKKNQLSMHYSLWLFKILFNVLNGHIIIAISLINNQINTTLKINNITFDS